MLSQIVRDHYETFRAVAAGWRDGKGLPAFIDDEFRGFLRCGWLAGGFARFRCDACRFERLVAFSCKGRAVCPSCGGCLTLPPRLRYALAFDHGLCRAVVGVFVRSVLDALRRRAVSELGAKSED